jgi:hypothetical protein
MANELLTHGDSSVVRDVQKEIEILTPVENLLVKNLKKTTLGIASLVPQEVAENLKQQWAKNLQVLVEMVPPPSTAPITVMEWDSEGGPNSFNYRNEDITQGLILPLYQKAQPLWIQPSVLSNPANPMIYWQN